MFNSRYAEKRSIFQDGDLPVATCLARCTQVTLVPEGQRRIAGGKRACERSPRMGGRMDFAPWKGAGRTGRTRPDQFPHRRAFSGALPGRWPILRLAARGRRSPRASLPPAIFPGPSGTNSAEGLLRKVWPAGPAQLECAKQVPGWKTCPTALRKCVSEMH